MHPVDRTRHELGKHVGLVMGPRRKWITPPTIHMRINYRIKITAQYAQDLCVKDRIQRLKKDIPLLGCVWTINITNLKGGGIGRKSGRYETTGLVGDTRGHDIISIV